MKTDLKILNGHLTTYQISQAIDLPIETTKDLLDKKISITDLDGTTQKKLLALEEALYED
ncbi:hypothetical protein [Phocicoccus pinnipedialis]|uniref:Uncharacterized protein n=1 Tax=Phocicoccus pinnipedialis TaxID=110845 RepID=A0A6V7R5X9_9BACL|nr:hypothetical protein [Jeotgalicoccus pinnipedialis]MBP1939797.1 hypothetical protein [Jeotgalicoccus pinnipedialis]CAD2072425.1 hypothetical protein JEOPIN946_00518 [Jeotgalicoccus pinnipedialis]